MTDESRILAVLDPERWTPRVRIAKRARIGTDRAHYAIHRLVDIGAVERKSVRVQAYGRPQHHYRVSTRTAQREAAA